MVTPPCALAEPCVTLTDVRSIVAAFAVVSEEPSPRFLGLTVAERNARVVRRTWPATSRQPPATLRVPAGVIITPALLRALPPPNGVCHLAWHATRPPIVWQGAGPHSPGAAVTVHLPDGAALDVSNAGARRRSAWRLLRASGKPSDGWLSRHVHRKISRVCSYALLRLGLSANHATLLVFLVGAGAAWLMAQTTRATIIAGTALFWFASVADGIDGEMARLTLSESAYGEQLDTAVDHLTYLFVCAGVMVGWWRQGMGDRGVALAAGVVAGVPLVVFWGMHLVRHARGLHGRFFVDTKPIETGIIDAARATGAPMLRLAAGVFVLFRREAFSLGFFLVALVTARRAVYPALVAGGLAVVGATFLAYRAEIEAAIVAPARTPDHPRS